MHLWRGDHGPFIRHAQLKFCRRLIVVPLSTFHRLAQLIGDPRGQLVFSFHTTRSGSTLLTQVRLLSVPPAEHEYTLCRQSAERRHLRLSI